MRSAWLEVRGRAWHSREGSGQSVVRDDDSFAVDEDVVRRQVAVHETPCVQLREPPRQADDGREQPVEVLPGGERRADKAGVAEERASVKRPA